MSLTDAAGTVHSPAGDGFRIACLVPSITECLCEMGLVEHLVARTGFCIHPRKTLQGVPKVGGTKDVDIAKLEGLQPTHVILNIDENRRETAERLAEFIPHLVVTHPQSPEDNLTMYQLLGGLFHRQAQADRLAEDLSSALDELAAMRALGRKNVLYLIWRKPWMSVAPDTYIARMLALVNWKTLPSVHEPRYPQITLEDFRGKVDLVLLSSEPYPFREKHLAMVEDQLGGSAEAHLIQGDMISWYGSRAIAGVRYLRDFAEELETRAA